MHSTPTLLRSIRRMPLTTKQVNKGFYKGTGTGSMGWHTKKGGYIVDLKKVRTYVCPPLEDLKKFELTPFVAERIEKPKRAGKLIDGKQYLEHWKEVNGQT